MKKVQELTTRINNAKAKIAVAKERKRDLKEQQAKVNQRLKDLGIEGDITEQVINDRIEELEKKHKKILKMVEKELTDAEKQISSAENKRP